MSVSKKLGYGFFIGTLLTVIVGVVGIIGMWTLRTSGLTMYQQQVIGIEQAGKALSAFENVRLNCRMIVIHSFYDDKKEALDLERRFEYFVGEFRDLMMLCDELSTDDELKHFIEVIVDMFEHVYMPIAEKIIEVSIDDIPDHNNRLHINVMLAHINDISDWIDNLMTGMIELNVAIAGQTSSNNELLTLGYIASQAVLLAITAVFAALIALYIIKSIMKPINESVQVLSKISTGDYEARIEGSYNDEFDKIKDTVNSMAVDIKKRELMISGISYASKVQTGMLPPDSIFKEAFSDHSVIWEPKDIVGGDIYWIRNFDEGTILCVCDCTGHGTHGALLTMLVISAFGTAVDESNYKDPASVIWELEKQLVSTLGTSGEQEIKDGCDLVVVFAAKDGTVSLSAGNTDVYVCDGNEAKRIRGQMIQVGEGELHSKDDVKVITIPANTKNKFYIASDGLYEQIGGESCIPFGYEIFEKIILEHHEENLSTISQHIWQAFETYMGNNTRRDDVQLITFQPMTH